MLRFDHFQDLDALLSMDDWSPRLGIESIYHCLDLAQEICQGLSELTGIQDLKTLSDNLEYCAEVDDLNLSAVNPMSENFLAPLVRIFKFKNLT